MGAQLAVLVTLIGAVALILRECGVFEAIRRRNLEKNWGKVKSELLEKAEEKQKEKVYDHKYPEDKS